MATRDSRPDLAAPIRALLDAAGTPANRDVLADILGTAARLAGDGADRLDLKITAAALREMRAAFRAFAPYKGRPKVTIFGSARTQPDDPVYALARDIAARLAESDWMVVTGAGPGIMAAGHEGAGRDHAFGVNIRLPFEQGANEFIARDPKLVEMKYFFTRKLMLLKESNGFVVLPGGFGTLDEAFELLTLLQTGKAEPAPIVLLDMPGGTYWQGWERFLDEEVASRGLVSPSDHALWLRTDNVDAAADEILNFYSNYHSLRYVAGRLVIRLQRAPTAAQLAALTEQFSDICVSGGIEAVDPSAGEVNDGDHVDLPRIALHFDRMQHDRLRDLINTLNSYAPMPDTVPESIAD